MLAEEKNGKIPKPVSFNYIWGDSLSHLERLTPDLRVINLETSVTAREDHWRGKQVNYRMNPKNTPCLTAAKIDCCALANNHILDWGYSGLEETLQTVNKVGIRTSGAGESIEDAESPVLLEVKGKGRVLFFSFGSESSGVPPGWAATANRAGVNLLDEGLSTEVDRVRRLVEGFKRQNDVAIVSIHWGANWGYEVPSEQRLFARRLIDEAGVDLIHGHSSHHAKVIEVYKNKLILYGCGDFLNDYEGIRGYESFRGDLGLMYLASLKQQTGKLLSLQMIPTQIKNFKVNNASANDALWLSTVLNRESRKFGSKVELNRGSLWLKWA
jgi:poly-gamma-glutamate synthesis protein (capsule biosynthesis protein)